MLNRKVSPGLSVRQYFLAKVNAQHLCRPVVSRRIYSASRSHNLEPAQPPPSSGGQSAFVMAHLGILGEEHIGIIFVGHRIS